GVLLRVDVVGDHRHVDAVAQPPAERLGEGRLAGADRAADADLEGARNAHERNSLASSVAWRRLASSSPVVKDHMSSALAAAAAAARRAMRGRIAASTRWPSTWPSATRRSPAPTSSAAVE